MRRVLAAALMGVVGFSLLLSEWNFVRRSRGARAVVTGNVVYNRDGKVLADAVHVVDGRRTISTIRAWYCRLRPGEQVGILYLPGDSRDAVLDRYWQRHYRSTFVLGIFVVLGYAADRSIVERRRRQAIALYRDDVIEPPIPSAGPIRLPIDTAPRLWDRELDG